MKTNKNENKQTSTEVDEKFAYRMKAYDDDGNQYPKKTIKTKNPANDDYMCAVRLNEKYTNNYGSIHTRFYKANKLVCVCIDGDVITQAPFPKVN